MSALGEGRAEMLDLSDPWKRLELARALVRSGDTPDEGAVALLRLADHDLVGPKAREELYALAIGQDLHPGWRDIYDTLLSKGDLTGDGKVLITMRSAAAAAADPSSRSRGISQLQSLVTANPRRSDIRLALGDALMRAGRVDEARAVYQGTEAGARANEATLLALIALGRLDEATEYVSALGMDPRGSVAEAARGSLADRAKVLAKAGFFDAAEAMLAKADPNRQDSNAWVALADGLLVAGDPKKAAAVLAKASAARAGDSAVRERWTSALLEAGDVNGAKQAAGDDEKSLQLVYAVQLVLGGAPGNASARADEIDRAWRMAPSQPEVVRNRVELLLAQGKVDEASKVLEPALAARPRSPALGALFDRVAIASNRPSEALAAHRAAMARTGPWDFWPAIGAVAGMHTLVAEQYKTQKQYDKAVEHYRIALALRPDAPEYFSGLGGTLWTAGRTQEGRAAYLQALKLAPNDVGLVQAAVQISLAQNDVDGALSILDRTTMKAPQIVKLREDVHVAQVLRQINFALDNGLESDARSAFQDLLVRYPDNGRILHALGDTLLRAGKASEALSAYQRARQFAPTDPWLAMAEATCHIQLGDYEKANPILDDIGDVQDEDTRAELRRVRARALRAQGDELWRERDQPEAAFEAYAQALSLDPEQWSLIALGGLYLDHRQPGAALAFFEEALTMDPGNEVAQLGRVNALQALGRLEDARLGLEAIGRGKAGKDPWKNQEDAEIQLAITEVDRRLLNGDPKGARKVLDDIAQKHPDSPHVDAAMASLLLSQGQPGMALQRAVRALEHEPTHGRALSVAMEAGMQTGKMSEVVPLYEHALDAGGGERARAALDNAMFAADIQQATIAASEGRRVEAQHQLDELREAIGDNPDHLSLLGGAYLQINYANVARDVYERALEIDGEHIPSLIGFAAAQEALGNVQAAKHSLSESYERTKDPRVGIALAQIQGRVGRWHSGLETLQDVRDAPATTGSKSSWGSSDPLRVLPLPSGKAVGDEPAAPYEGLSGQVSLSQVAQLEDDLGDVHYPYGDLGGGFLGRTGESGQNQMATGFVAVTMDDLAAGPLRLHLDVLSLLVSDGVQQNSGIAGSVGIASASGRRLTLEGRLGTSPVGIGSGSPYVTWLGTIRLAVDPHVTIGIDTGRVPVTESLLSWTGKNDIVTGQFFGQASFTWGGGWLSLMNPNLTDGGARFRAGFVEALGMSTNGRREFTGWVGQTLGGRDLHIRLGSNITWMSYDRQIEDFVLNTSDPSDTGVGVFSPLTYIVGLFTADLHWQPTFSGTTVCASGALGAQNLTGTSSVYMSAGTYPAFSGGFGLGFPIANDWRVGLDGKIESSGNRWQQQAVLFRIGYFPPWTGRSGFARPSEIHGTTVGSAGVCRS